MPIDQEYSPLPTVNMNAPVQAHSPKSHNSFGNSFKKFAHRPKYVLGSVVALSMFAVLGFGLLAAMTSFNQNTDDRSQASTGFAVDKGVDGEGDGTETYDCTAHYQEPERVLECQALVALYESTNGSNWRDKTRWLTEVDYCSWYGVTCVGESSSRRVSAIDLQINWMYGELPSEINNFLSLTHLALQTNYLYGSIPSNLDNLTNLTYLSLARNNFSGRIPLSLSSLINLNFLELSYNQLSGEFPLDVSLITPLNQVYFNNQAGTKICVFPQTRIALENIVNNGGYVSPPISSPIEVPTC